jgi:hypothetical protein
MSPQVLVVTPDARRSSGQASISIGTFQSVGSLEAEETTLRHFVVPPEYCLLALPSYPNLSQRMDFKTYVVVSSGDNVSVINTSKDGVLLLHYKSTSDQIGSHRLPAQAALAQGPSPQSWTAPLCNLVAHAVPETSYEFLDIDNLMIRMQRGELPSRSAKLIELAQKAVEVVGRQPKEIEDWAARLAKDVVDADD